MRSGGEHTSWRLRVAPCALAALAAACATHAPERRAPEPAAQQPQEQQAPADAPAATGEDLAAQARDPTAALTAFQVRIDHVASFHGTGDLPGASQTNLVLQPIIPWSLGGQRHIARVTLPFILSAPDFGILTESEDGVLPPPSFVPQQDVNGLGDIALVDLFLWDVAWGRVGVGPALVLPTATDPALGSEKLSVGPAIVAIHRAGELQIGALAQALFSVAGDSDRSDVSMLSLQPFASYGLGAGWSVGSSEVVYNYDLEASTWTSVPLGLRAEKLVFIGTLPTRIYLDAEYNFQDEALAPEWTFRLAFVPLL
jgi:hypothetical protein